MNPRNSIILCVDDEEANFKLLEKLLIPRGYAVVSAASGKDALLQIKSQAIDLVLLDIIMPGMDGFEVCRQIKEDQKLRSIPVIMVTALTAKQDRIRGIEAGAEEFLSKPFDLAEVLARINILLKMKGLDDERKRAESQREAALQDLQKSHDELDNRVRERTAELAQTNEMLQVDITELKRVEEALLESEERYRALFDRSLELVYIHDFEGHFIDANEAALNLFGYKKEELRDLDIASLLSEDQLPFTRKTMQEIRETGFQKDLTECRLRLRNGNEVYVETKGSAIISKGTYTGIQVLARNITERKQAEEKIKNSLAEKEVLLKEVHHRVKNNLMIIIGLIKMQETKAANEMFNPLMQELEGRIRAMALVHEGLYKSADLAHVNLQNYIEMMSTQIHAQFGVDRDIRFSVQAAGVDVDLDSAVPCGLILNELIANAFKHAFPDGRTGSGAGNCEINVIVNQAGGMIGLAVADNGVGLPADLDWEKSDTLGLRLIKMLSKQINGSIELDRSAGTVFRLKFPMAV